MDLTELKDRIKKSKYDSGLDGWWAGRVEKLIAEYQDSEKDVVRLHALLIAVLNYPDGPVAQRAREVIAKTAKEFLGSLR